MLQSGTRSRDEAEKPFWISYADLMTALMVLFLIVMSVALLAVIKPLTEQERQKLEHERSVDALMRSIEVAAAKFSGIQVDRDRKLIDFGDRERFDVNVYQLRTDQAQLLRAFVPELLSVAATDAGSLLKRIVIEGFADQSGSYLYNLDLSLKRSQSVLCALFAAPEPQETPLTESQLAEIRDLFLVGGYSFNSARQTAAESRRVEFRLELYEGNAPGRALQAPPGNFGDCRLR